MKINVPAVIVVIILSVIIVSMIGIRKTYMKEKARIIANHTNLVAENVWTNSHLVATARPRLDDIIMESRTAISNATSQGLPKNWGVACDKEGHFAPYYIPTEHVISLPICIRTSLFEAVVAAWRVQEIWDNPPKIEIPTLPTLSQEGWRLCDKTNTIK